MRPASVFLYGGLFTMLAFLTTACNTILGVEDVDLDCHVNSHFLSVSSDPVEFSQSRFLVGDQTIFQLKHALNIDANPDNLLIEINEKFLGFGHTPIADFDPCIAVCVRIEADFDAATNMPLQRFDAILGNSLYLNPSSDQTQLYGSIIMLKFRHVNLDTSIENTIDANDSCTVTIDDIEFNFQYPLPPSL
jgi:hypothetical protein